MIKYFNQKQFAADSSATAKLVSAFVKPNKDDGNSCPDDAIKMKLQGQDACRTVCWDTEDKSRPEGKKGSKTTTGQCAGYPGLTFSKSSWTISGPGGQNFTNAFDILDGKQNRCDTLHNIGPFDDQCCTGGAGSKCEKKGQDSWGWAYGEGLFPYKYSASCPGNCSEHGTCKTDGNCTCDTGWNGDDACSTCTSGWGGADCACNPATTCSGHGTCDPTTGECHCTQGTGWMGTDCAACKTGWTDECTTAPSTGCVPPCDVHGTCTNGACACDKGWDGDATCSTCTSGWGGADCTCNPATTCSGHGTCDPTTGECHCTQGTGWMGTDCAACKTGWTDECTTAPSTGCVPPCDVHGTCTNGACACDKGWDGDATCSTCTSGWGGTDCTTPPAKSLWACDLKNFKCTSGDTGSPTQTECQTGCWDRTSLWCSTDKKCATAQNRGDYETKKSTWQKVASCADCSKTAPPDDDKKGGKGLIILLAVIAGVILLAIAGLIIFYFVSSKKAPRARAVRTAPSSAPTRAPVPTRARAPAPTRAPARSRARKSPARRRRR